MGPAQTSHFKHAKFNARKIYCSRSFVIASAQVKIPCVPEDIFFLSILMVRGEAESTRRGLSHLGYFENGPLKPVKNSKRAIDHTQWEYIRTKFTMHSDSMYDMICNFRLSGFRKVKAVKNKLFFSEPRVRSYCVLNIFANFRLTVLIKI